MRLPDLSSRNRTDAFLGGGFSSKAGLPPANGSWRADGGRKLQTSAGASTQRRARGDLLGAVEDEIDIANPAVWTEIFAATRPA